VLFFATPLSALVVGAGAFDAALVPQPAEAGHRGDDRLGFAERSFEPTLTPFDDVEHGMFEDHLAIVAE
jgi:hypothetical protein